MAQNSSGIVLSKQNLRMMCASLEGQFARLQFEHGHAQGLLQTQRDTILGLNGELEWQKLKTADLEMKLSQIESSNNCEKVQFEQTIKSLTEQLDMQNRLISSLTNEQKTKRLNESPKTKEIFRSINELRQNLKDLKTYVIAENRGINQKLKDARFVCARLPIQAFLEGSNHKIDESKYIILQKQILEEFCDEIEKTSSEMMNEVKNL